MDGNSIPMSGGEQDLIDLSETKTHDGQEQDAQRHVDHHDSQTVNGVGNSAPEPVMPTIDPAVQERLRLSLEHNMADLAEMCFNTMSDEYPSPCSLDMENPGRDGRGPATSLNTAADHAYVIPNRPRVFVPFHVMEAVYGKPVPMQSYDSHASMLPLSHDVLPFLPPPMAVRAYAPLAPARYRRRPLRRTGSPTQRPSRTLDGTGAGGLRARSLDESPGRKFAAMLGRCTTALAAISTTDLLGAYKKLAGELERRGVGIGPGLVGSDEDTDRAASQRQTSSKSDPGRGHAKIHGCSNKKASAKMDDPFTE